VIVLSTQIALSQMTVLPHVYSKYCGLAAVMAALMQPDVAAAKADGGVSLPFHHHHLEHLNP
jgi:hypothetical protein